MTVPITLEKLAAWLLAVQHLSKGEPMNILVQLPEPLATQAAAAAKSHATSLEQYVIQAVANTIAQEPSSSAGEQGDPVFGSFAEDADLLDSVVEHAMTRRRTSPARTVDE